jgi:hypothetical protein
MRIPRKTAYTPALKPPPPTEHFQTSSEVHPTSVSPPHNTIPRVARSGSYLRKLRSLLLHSHPGSNFGDTSKLVCCLFDVVCSYFPSILMVSLFLLPRFLLDDKNLFILLSATGEKGIQWIVLGSHLEIFYRQISKESHRVKFSQNDRNGSEGSLHGCNSPYSNIITAC